MKTRPAATSIKRLSDPHIRSLAVLLVVAWAAAPLAAQNTPPPPVPQGEGRANATPPAAVGQAAAEAPLDPLSPDQLQRYGIDRYDKIVEKSPFAFKIVRPEEGPPPISFATDLALAGFTVDDGKGIKYASIVDKKTNARFVIRTDRPNADGIQLVQLNRGQTLLESSVLARKGAEEAQISSDKQIVERKAVVNAAVIGQPVQNMNQGRGGQPGGNVNLNLNPNRPGNVQGQINTQLQQQPQPGAVPQQGGQQAAGLPPGAVQGNVQGNVQVNAQATAVQGGGAPLTAGDLSVQAAQPQQQQPQRQQRDGRPGQAPGRRRVILPPTN